jgi:hypothetical protein
MNGLGLGVTRLLSHHLHIHPLTGQGARHKDDLALGMGDTLTFQINRLNGEVGHDPLRARRAHGASAHLS